MTDPVEVDATLLVEDGDDQRPLNVDDFGGDDVVEAINALAGQAATDATLALILAAQDAPLDITDRAARLLGHVTVDASPLPAGAATAAKQDAATALLTALGGTDFATHATQTAIKAVLDQIEANTAALSVDVAQLELTADQVNLSTDDLEALLTALNGRDFAEQATLVAAKAVLDSIDAKDFATETTLAAVYDRLAETLSVDVSDRAGRLLGRVTVENPTEVGLAKDATLVELRNKVPADPAREGGNLAAIAAKDFASSAKQDTHTTRLTEIRDELAQKLEPADLAGLATALGQASQIARLDALLGSVDQLEGYTDTLEALLGPLATEATLLNVFRRTDPLAAGANLIGYISQSIQQKVGLGRVMMAGSGMLNLSVAGNIRATFSNPAGSGKTISVVRLVAMATATGFATVRLNPTTGLPGSAARPVLNAIAGGGNAASAQLKVDTDPTTALGGGTDTGEVIGIPANNRVSIDLPPLVLAPGVTLGIGIPFAGAANAAMSIYWVED